MPVYSAYACVPCPLPLSASRASLAFQASLATVAFLASRVRVLRASQCPRMRAVYPYGPLETPAARFQIVYSPSRRRPPRDRSRNGEVRRREQFAWPSRSATMRPVATRPDASRPLSCFPSTLASFPRDSRTVLAVARTRPIDDDASVRISASSSGSADVAVASVLAVVLEQPLRRGDRGYATRIFRTV